MRFWLINAIFPFFMCCSAALAGWWVRGRFQESETEHNKRLVRDAMLGLQDCTTKIRTRIAAHVRQLEELETKLADGSESGSADVTTVAGDILNANMKVRHQLTEIEQRLAMEAEIIGRSIADEKPELLFTKCFDRKERLYKNVLCSLELLSTELATDVGEHRARVQEIGDVLTDENDQTLENVVSAVSQIMDATSKMQHRISRSETRLEEQAEHLASKHKEAVTDELTGLANRRSFNKELERLHNEYKLHDNAYSLLLIDVDHFKKVNDSHGHSAGDAVLKKLGSALVGQIRDSDLAARYGGEEFAVLLSYTSLEDASQIAERVRKACAANNVKSGGKMQRITVSIGVSGPKPDQLAETTLEWADHALYAAKEAGRNRTYWHDGVDCHAVGAPETGSEVREKGPKEKEASTSRVQIDKAKPVTKAPAKTTSPPEYLELSNRSIFCANVNRRIAEAQRGGPQITVLLIYIDQTEEILKKHGPAAVAHLKEMMSRLLAAFTRNMDERCEYGDEIFAVLLPATTASSAQRIGERLRAGVAGCFMQWNDDRYALTASIGVTNTAGGDSGMELLRRGEVALQTAAEQGGNAAFFAEGERIAAVTSQVVVE